jgi:hypothetical protein
MKNIHDFGAGLRKPSILLLMTLLFGCKEEKSVIYSERIGILPDRSGYLAKDLRTWDKNKAEIAISEVRKSGTREIFLIALQGIDDVKFKSRTKGDTIHLYHTESTVDKNTSGVNAPSFPVRLEFLSGQAWLGSGTTEGDPILYAEDKWEAVLQMMNRD